MGLMRNRLLRAAVTGRRRLPSGPVVAVTTWSDTLRGIGIVTGPDKRSAWGADAWRTILSTTSKQTGGRHYAEITRLAGNNVNGIGIATLQANRQTYVSAGAPETMGYLWDGRQGQNGDASGTPWPSGFCVLQVALDLEQLEVRFGLNGDLSPALPLADDMLGDAVYLAATLNTNAENQALRLNTGHEAFVYAPPSGFTPWG